MTTHQKTPFSPYQDPRLGALVATGLVGSAREQDFDDIVAYVAELCEAPVCLISLVEDERQWFKATHGTELRETPISQSICLHALTEDEILEIPDTALDPRTVDNPLCQGPEAFRFYAGALLRLENEIPLGTLCVLDHKPRHLTSHQRRTILLLARQVVRQIELREALAMQKRLQAEIDHRVKNSLQMVASYLRMQRRGASEEACQVLLDAEQRVAAISALHAAINDTGGGSVPLAHYLGRIAQLLDESLPKNVSVRVAVEEAYVPPERAAALGLIVNEFVTNSVKHAFPNERVGSVTLTGQRNGGLYRLVLADDGTGFSEVTETPSLGLKIIGAASRQLQAKAAWSQDTEGTCLTLSFSASEALPAN
ncbi:histidine kinase dimerization/phosphoacceptor domain -containing protein [Roseitranquillus sediminis]|uniref:histidine kinase dimerization/phosphoacceptor domain -containing protein n=1 Tax=Roseitranquillus sediminis TaxID=2809051 RepID=UPI001D0C2826|nr:histidine kinase dimerization/phosphoacceptor domain -containing protein [Roseitranquillus sediminis]MBM9594351.1 GAF domain-containing protein [Roseitranquillus sediminis]